jgi:ribonuclease BN (tRNA processing enzyme)
MRLTICGSSPAWADPGGACSGYLVSEAGTNLLIDCGNGALAYARKVCSLLELSAVFLTHMHGDHTADLLCLAYALRHGWQRPEPLPVWGPKTMAATLRTLARGACADPNIFDEVFALHVYEATEGGRPAVVQPEHRLTIGALTLTMASVPHSISTVAVDVRADSGARFTLSADCGPNQTLPVLARDTRLLLCEATAADSDSDVHLSGAGAGEIATAANAQSLLLVHYTGELREHLLKQAAATFKGEIDAAYAGLQIEL